MCGFLSIVSDHWKEDFDVALDSLKSRGPDHCGTWHEENVYMGHQRLAILDLTAAGNQPFMGGNGRYILVYNGEIYNFKDLRKKLERDGIVFQSHCDTEVLMQGLIHWGIEKILPELDGIFAFTLWDRVEKTMIGARDRFGIKPLFYSTNQGLIASSTLAPFWKIKNFPKKLNPQAMRDYLCADTVFSPHTILQDVQSLNEGSWFTWKRGQKDITSQYYWTVPSVTHEPLALNDLVDATEKALIESVSRQMISDVPLGAFLSGGIDSSLLVHYMAQSSSQRIKTFSVKFPQNKKYDESQYARIVAQKYNTEHIEMDAQDLTASQVVDAIQLLDQPLADPAYLPTLSISKMARQHVTVAISGDGGDEVFGGYGRFLQDEAFYSPTLKNRIFKMMDQCGVLPGSLLRRSLSGQEMVLWQRLRLGPYAKGRKALHPLMHDELWKSCKPELTLEKWQTLTKSFNNKMDADSLIRSDLWTYLSDNCLVKTDRASMAHSLEVRVPMLGNPVVDLMAQQPASL